MRDKLRWIIKKKLYKPKGPLRGSILVNLLYNHHIYPQRIAEIGVWRGHTSLFLLDNIPSIKEYILVDPWKTYVDYKKSGDMKANRNLVIDKYICEDRLQYHQHKLKWIQEQSNKAVNQISNKYLDLVFIDANHAYKYVKEDIDLWWPKVKKGGILAGHDYDEQFPGVIKAVNEFSKRISLAEDSVWWIKK